MPRRATALLAAAVVLGGCAHVATNEPGATIWVDGRPIGPSGRIWALGPPHRAHVVVVAKDGRRARAVMGREFTWNTFEGGFYTMGLCFVLCWAYPEEVFVTLPPPRPRAESWDDDSWDAVWLAPPSPATTPREAVHPERHADAPAAARSRGTAASASASRTAR